MKLSPLHSESGTMQWFQFCRYASVILISIVIAACLDIADVGRVEYIFFLANMFSFFWLSGVKNQMLSFLGKKASDERKFWLARYYKIVQTLSIAFVLVFLLAQVCFGLLEWTNPLYMLFLVLLISPIGNLADAILILTNRLKLLRAYATIIHLARIVLIASVAYIYRDWEAIIFAYFIWLLLKWFFVTGLVFMSRAKHPEVLPKQTEDVKRTIYKSIASLSLFALLGGCMDYVDGVMVKYFFGDADFAMFKYGAREFPLSLLWASAVTTALLPSFSENEQEGTATLKNQLTKWIPILFGSAGVLILLSPWLYEWVYGSAFRLSALIFNIYLLIIITRVLLPQLIYYARGWNSALVVMGLVELLVNIVLSLILLHYYGLIGIVIATCIAFLVEKIMYISYLRFRSDYSFWDAIPVKSYLTWSLLLMVCFGISTYYYYL